MKIKNKYKIIKLLLLILLIYKDNCYAQEDFNFEDFLQGIIQEISGEPTPEGEYAQPQQTAEKSKEVPLEKPEDIKTNFLKDFTPEKKEGAPAAEKPVLPKFKEEALEHFLETFSNNLEMIEQKIAGLDEYEKRKFAPHKTVMHDISSTIKTILSNKVYYPVLFTPPFSALRKKILDMSENLKNLNKELDVALTPKSNNLSNKKIEQKSNSKAVATEQPPVLKKPPQQTKNPEKNLPAKPDITKKENTITPPTVLSILEKLEKEENKQNIKNEIKPVQTTK